MGREIGSSRQGRHQAFQTPEPTLDGQQLRPGSMKNFHEKLVFSKCAKIKSLASFVADPNPQPPLGPGAQLFHGCCADRDRELALFRTGLVDRVRVGVLAGETHATGVGGRWVGGSQALGAVRNEPGVVERRSCTTHGPLTRQGEDPCASGSPLPGAGRLDPRGLRRRESGYEGLEVQP